MRIPQPWDRYARDSQMNSARGWWVILVNGDMLQFPGDAIVRPENGWLRIYTTATDDRAGVYLEAFYPQHQVREVLRIQDRQDG
jgi:hypothetical protein